MRPSSLEAPSSADDTSDAVRRALKAVREHLGMEVAYLSEFVGDRAVFREVDAPGLEHLIKPGDSHRMDDVYCPHILADRLPQLIPDTAREPIATAMPITKAVPIGAHVSVPITLPGGETYGMFCCLSPTPNASLNDRDLATMRMFADLATDRIARDVAETRGRREAEARITDLMEAKRCIAVFQPIWDLGSDRIAGFECLSRFQTEPYRPPNEWFDEAARAGLGVELELASIVAALDGRDALPGGAYVSLNASPETILSDAFKAIITKRSAGRVMLEITEHAAVADYQDLQRALAPMRAEGLVLAVDDAGAGYASFSHILQLTPDVIKLDMALVRDIDTDVARRALAAALVLFANEVGIQVVAEGVETAAELNVLRSLGVSKAQGYLLSKPLSLADARAKLAAHEIDTAAFAGDARPARTEAALLFAGAADMPKAA